MAFEITGPVDLSKGVLGVFGVSGCSLKDPVYSWTIEDGDIEGAVLGTRIQAKRDTAGTFTLHVTATENFQVEDAELEITVHESPVCDIVQTDVLLVADVDTFNGPADMESYAWEVIPGTGSGHITSGGDAQEVTIAGDKAGTVTVKLTVTDEYGGAATDTLVVTVHAKPKAQILGPVSVSKNDVPTFEVHTDAASPTYLWQVTNGSITGGQGTAIAEVTPAAGSHPFDMVLTCIVTDGVTAAQAVASFTVTVEGLQDKVIVSYLYGAPVGGTTDNARASARLTKSWGLSPGTASLTFFPADPETFEIPAITSPNYIYFQLASGVIWFGRIKEFKQGASADGGVTYVLDAEDMRVMLQDYRIYGAFNMMDDRGRLYTIVPNGYEYEAGAFVGPGSRFDWTISYKSYFDDGYGLSPVPTAAILDLLKQLLNPVGIATAFSWVFNYSEIAAQIINESEHWIRDLDCLNGKPVGTLMAEIAESLGLSFTVAYKTTSGAANVILWDRPGESVADVSGLAADPKNVGVAVADYPDKVEVVGDRNLYQVKFDLVPNWNEEYNYMLLRLKFEDELEACKTALGVVHDEVTLEQFATFKSDVKWLDNDPVTGKPKTYQGYNRNKLPIWYYIQNLVLKCYKVAIPDGTRGDPPLQAPGEESPIAGRQIEDLLPLWGELLVTLDDDGNPTSERETTKRSAVVFGQFWTFNPRNPGNLFTFLAGGAVEMDGWRLDPETGEVFFAEPRLGNTSDLVTLKVGKDYWGDPMNILIPNPGYEIVPDKPYIVCVVQSDRYFRVVGDGTRTGIHYERGLAKQVVLSGATLETQNEVTIPANADDIADMLAAGMLNHLRYVASGDARRVDGVIGQELDNRFDRINVQADSGGRFETFYFTHQRKPIGTQFTRRDLEMARRRKDGDVPADLQKFRQELAVRKLYDKLEAQQAADRIKLNELATPVYNLDEYRGAEHVKGKCPVDVPIGTPLVSYSVEGNGSGIGDFDGFGYLRMLDPAEVYGLPIFSWHKFDTQQLWLTDNNIGVGVVTAGAAGVEGEGNEDLCAANKLLTLATSGRVWCRVCGPVEKGDNLIIMPGLNYAVVSNDGAYAGYAFGRAIMNHFYNSDEIGLALVEMVAPYRPSLEPGSVYLADDGVHVTPYANTRPYFLVHGDPSYCFSTMWYDHEPVALSPDIGSGESGGEWFIVLRLNAEYLAEPYSTWVMGDPEYEFLVVTEDDYYDYYDSLFTIVPDETIAVHIPLARIQKENCILEIQRYYGAGEGLVLASEVMLWLLMLMLMEAYS